MSKTSTLNIGLATAIALAIALAVTLGETRFNTADYMMALGAPGSGPGEVLWLVRAPARSAPCSSAQLWGWRGR